MLPISNPANLVIYGSHMPPLLQWLPRYALPSVLSIVATYAVLRWTQRRALRRAVSRRHRGAGAVRCAASWRRSASSPPRWCCWRPRRFDLQLGLPTFLAGLATALLVLMRSEQRRRWRWCKDISWGVLPLVAGLFVLVEALEKTGVTRRLADAAAATWCSAPRRRRPGRPGVVLAVGCNLVNNLPAGLVAGRVVRAGAGAGARCAAAVLIGVDLGPNLSVTGSLATILWLTALRREGQRSAPGPS